jgi:hypothetical protein
MSLLGITQLSKPTFFPFTQIKINSCAFRAAFTDDEHMAIYNAYRFSGYTQKQLGQPSRPT